MRINDSPASNEIRKGPIILCGLVGLAMVAGAFAADSAGWWDMWPAALLEVGAAFLLAGILFLVERTFEGRVVEKAKAAVETRIKEQDQRIDEQEERLNEQEERISERLSELNEAASQLARQRSTQADERVAAISQQVDFRTITKALEECNDLSALDGDAVEVDAGSGPRSLTLTFAWGWHYRSHESAYGHPDECYLLALEVRGENERDRCSLDWPDNLTGAEFYVLLQRQLQKSSMWNGTSTVDWTLAVERLQSSLKVALDARRVESGDWNFSGAPLMRLFGDDLALTTNGLHRRRAGVVVTDGDARAREDSGATWPPPLPQGIDVGDWTAAVTEMERRFPVHSPFSGLRASRPFGSEREYYVPKTSSDSPPDAIADAVCD